MERILFCLVIFLVTPMVAQATSYDFAYVKGSTQIVGLGSQLQLDVTNGSGVVNFTFSDNGAITSDIFGIYFGSSQEHFPLVFSSFSHTGVVDYLANSGTPDQLPGGTFTTDWRAIANHPAPKNGVNNGPADSLTISFSGLSLSDVISEINSGTLSIGLHVAGVSGLSYAYEISPTPASGLAPTPEPATMLLFGVGLAGFAGWRLKKE